MTSSSRWLSSTECSSGSGTLLNPGDLRPDMRGHLSSGAAGVRVASIAICVVMCVAGVVLCVLGSEIDNFLLSRLVNTGAPPLWWTGIGPVVIGMSGITAAATGQKKWVLLWVGVTTVVGSTCYTVMSLSGCLDAARYGVTLQIYGECADLHQTCMCRREDGSVISPVLSLSVSSCADIRHVTTMYLLLLVSLLVCLSSGVIVTILGCVAALCVECCLHKERLSGHSTLPPQCAHHLRIPVLPGAPLLSVSLPPPSTATTSTPPQQDKPRGTSTAEYTLC